MSYLVSYRKPLTFPIVVLTYFNFTAVEVD